MIMNKTHLFLLPLLLTTFGWVTAAEIELVEKKLEDFSDLGLSAEGVDALAMKPDKWKHAETKNFYVHFRRVTEAKKVVREIEFNADYIIEFLGKKAPEGVKSNVFVFEDDDEWKAFLKHGNGLIWSASFAMGDDLYLNVRESSSGRFDSGTLAHETAHAVVNRLYPRSRLPLWLNEGFAEYISGVAVAARKSQYTKGNQRRLDRADLTVVKLVEMPRYPSDPVLISQLYQSAEKVVRFLIDTHGKERFVRMIDLLMGGADFESAFKEGYSDLYPTLESLQKKLDNYRG